MSDPKWEPYAGWLRAFEGQRRLSSMRLLDLGEEPMPDEVWDRWRDEMLKEFAAREKK
jgi:hypothetical protein